MKPETTSDYEARIARARRHIEANLDATHALDDLARVASFSPFHFHRVFRGVTGESVAAYVRRLKLSRAAHWLRYSERSVIDIALASGYGAHAPFTRAFRRAFGCSPSEWRVASLEYAPQSDEAPPMPVDVEVLGSPVERLLTLRHSGPYEAVGTAWSTLFAQLGRWPWAHRASPVGLVWDDPEVTPPHLQRCDVGVPIPAGICVDVTHPLTISAIPARRWARAIHVGPYTTLSQTYAHVCGVWAREQGKKLGDQPSMERYLVGPPSGVSPTRYRTEVWVPLG